LWYFNDISIYFSDQKDIWRRMFAPVYGTRWKFVFVAIKGGPFLGAKKQHPKTFAIPGSFQKIFL